MTLLLKYPKCLLSAAIVMGGVVMGIVYRNDLWDDTWEGLISLQFLVPITLIFSLTALVVFVWKRRIGKLLKHSLAIGWSLVLSIILFVETGGWINQYKVNAVEEYVARAVPILDQIKEKQGAYPDKLPTGILGEPPELLRDYGRYTATRSSFYIEYIDEPAESAISGGPNEFDSDTRKWEYH